MQVLDNRAMAAKNETLLNETNRQSASASTSKGSASSSSAAPPVWTNLVSSSHGTERTSQLPGSCLRSRTRGRAPPGRRPSIHSMSRLSGCRTRMRSTRPSPQGGCGPRHKADRRQGTLVNQARLVDPSSRCECARLAMESELPAMTGPTGGSRQSPSGIVRACDKAERGVVGRVHPASRAVMRANRRRDTAPEMAVRKLVHAAGLRYRVDTKPLPKPQPACRPGVHPSQGRSLR